MKTVLSLLLILLLAACGSKKETAAIVYPAPLPDSVALRFLPGIVSGDSLDFNSAFSPDGRSFYFARSKKGKWIILETRFDGKTWLAPVPAAFADTTYSNADPFITADGTVYFMSNRPKNAADTIADYDIWITRPAKDGGWSAPENITAINTDNTEYYVSVAANRNIYFSSMRAGGYGENDIYMSRWDNDHYTTPVNLGIAVNTTGGEHDPLIAPDESFLIYTSYGQPDTIGQADLYYSIHTNGQWSKAKNLGPAINTATYEYCPNFSPDGKYFFYSSEYDVKWISAAYVRRLMGIK